MGFRELRILIIITGLFVFHVNAQQKPILIVTSLRCDLLEYTDLQVGNDGYLINSKWVNSTFSNTNSVKIVNKKPTFGWEIQTDGRNVLQTAFRIIISTSLKKLEADDGDLWDSGKVLDQQSTSIQYDGLKDLKPNTMYFWKVMVWDNNKNVSLFSKPSVFFTDSMLLDYGTSRYPLLKHDEKAKNIMCLKEGNYFIDFEKASFGQLNLTFDNKINRTLDSIKVNLGEVLQDTSFRKIDANPGGSRRYREFYINIKPGIHTYSIRFEPDGWNTGNNAVLMPEYIGEVLPFRYVEILATSDVELLNATRKSVNYPFNDNASYFESSDSILNKVWDLSKYSIKATSFAGVYVDGDRERIPYEGDAYINQLCHYSVDNEFSMARYTHEYLMKNATWPTEWILQSVLIAKNDLFYTGDKRSALHFYDDLKAKALMDLEDKNGLISTRTGKQSKEFLNSINFKGKELKDIVDWPQAGILGLEKDNPGETDGFVFDDYNAVVNAFYFKALNDLASIARSLSKIEDVEMFLTKANMVRANYNKTFFDKSTNIYKDGNETDHSSLHANMFALAFGLVDPENAQDVVSFIKERGMACSVYGSQFLLDAVYLANEGDYGLSLLRSKSERSWYNMIRKGSTITMEAWDDIYKPNQDWNHAWGAVPANIIPRKLMGIEPLVPGWDYFQIKPQIGNLSYAALTLPTIKGEIQVTYNQAHNMLNMQFEIPANTQADIYIPLKNISGRKEIHVNGHKVVYNKKNDINWHVVKNLGSGEYEIKVKGY